LVLVLGFVVDVELVPVLVYARAAR